MTDEIRNYDQLFEAQFDKLNSRIDNLLEYNERQDKNTGKILKILEGNGNPEKGLIVQNAQAKIERESIKSTLKIHWGLFASTFIVIAGAVIKFLLG